MAETRNRANKSWIELCDEEIDNQFDHEIKVKEEMFFESENAMTSPLKDFAKPEVKVEKEERPKTMLSYANAVKFSPVNGIKPTNDINLTDNVNVYTPSKEDFPDCIKGEKRKSSRRQIQKEFLQEDLSLSSHLDVFHMVSPCKQESFKDKEKSTPTKEGRVTKVAKRRINMNPIASDNSRCSRSDDVLMPSPRMTRSSRRNSEATGRDKPIRTRKRQREDSLGSSTKNKEIRQEKEVVYETDEAVLVRRQKQIDYGKNTIGYERYTQLVPIDKRDKKHPHTPPKHTKYSRRAWDGLVRVWRQRLHFWDPPSQGGGNPDCLSEISSCETASVSSSNSQSSTPWKEDKRRVRAKQESVSSDSSANSVEDDLEVGCMPLEHL